MRNNFTPTQFINLYNNLHWGMQEYAVYRNLYVSTHRSEKTTLEAEIEQLFFPSHLHKQKNIKLSETHRIRTGLNFN